MSRGRYDSVNDVCIPTAGNGGGSQITVDDALSDTSENPVQNKVIKQALDDVDSDITAEATARATADSAFTSEIADMNNVLGTKNLLPNNATTQTVNGVTFTVNSDGTVRANGTATANTVLTFVDNINFGIETILTGGTTSNKFLRAKNLTSGTYYDDYGNGIVLPQTSNSYHVYLIIVNGETLSNEVFKPMIRPASIKDDTYVPYAMTNRELTELTYNKRAVELAYTTSSNTSVKKKITATGFKGFVLEICSGRTCYAFAYIPAAMLEPQSVFTVYAFSNSGSFAAKGTANFLYGIASHDNDKLILGEGSVTVTCSSTLYYTYLYGIY